MSILQVDADVAGDEEMNEMLMRTEEEYDVWQKMDEERAREMGGKDQKRLMQENEVRCRVYRVYGPWPGVWGPRYWGVQAEEPTGQMREADVGSRACDTTRSFLYRILTICFFTPGQVPESIIGPPFSNGDRVSAMQHIHSQQKPREGTVTKRLSHSDYEVRFDDGMTETHSRAMLVVVEEPGARRHPKTLNPVP